MVVDIGEEAIFFPLRESLQERGWLRGAYLLIYHLPLDNLHLDIPSTNGKVVGRMGENVSFESHLCDL